MRISYILTTIILSSLTTTIIGQKKGVVNEVVNRRSSLHTILIESEKFPKKDTVMQAYFNAPFPDKYNNHKIDEKSFNPMDYYPTKEELGNQEKSKGGKLLGSMVNESKDEMGIDTMNKNMPFIIEKYFKQNKVANKMVAKWFNRQDDGSFNMNYIAEQGMYDATEMETNIAKGTARGIASIADAGEELIKKSFITVNKLKFVDNEKTAAIVRDALYESIDEGDGTPSGKEMAKKLADKVYNKTKEGYSVWTTSYLYQLVWNDSIEALFYSNLWMDNSSIDPERKKAFDDSDLFQLKFIGKEKATSLITATLKKETRTESQIIEMATIRNLEKAYAKLQKKYDAFKTKTPLLTSDPISAKIGMKEGLVGGEKFEVFEQVIDKKTGLTKYVSKGKISVDKKSIWDNRYIELDLKKNDAESTDQVSIKATTFKGGKNFYPGMLIRQVK